MTIDHTISQRLNLKLTDEATSNPVLSKLSKDSLLVLGSISDIEILLCQERTLFVMKRLQNAHLGQVFFGYWCKNQYSTFPSFFGSKRCRNIQYQISSKCFTRGAASKSYIDANLIHKCTLGHNMCLFVFATILYDSKPSLKCQDSTVLPYSCPLWDAL